MGKKPYFITRSTMAAVFACGAALAAAPVSAVPCLVNWTGANGDALGGVFSLSDALLGTVITGTDLDSLTFDLTLNGVSQGTGDLGPGEVENFNFDSATGAFSRRGCFRGPERPVLERQSSARGLCKRERSAAHQ